MRNRDGITTPSFLRSVEAGRWKAEKGRDLKSKGKEGKVDG